MKILVTGAAGFIGYHVAQRLLNEGHEVVSIDNLSEYYDVSLKHARLNRLAHHINFVFEKIDIADRAAVPKIFARHHFDRVIHLAAQAGVRYSIENPDAYIDSNIVGFQNILEACRQNKIEHLVYASSSSVYGSNTKMPLATSDAVDHPISLYAATKRANELMAHTYSHLFNLPTTGLRFFTVYGPWGRPDMALFKFTEKILAGEPIDVYNNGEMIRDWTFVDDIVTGVIESTMQIPQKNPSWNPEVPNPSASSAPFKIYNLGGGTPVKLSVFIEALEAALGKKAVINYMPMQPGDVSATHADTTDLQRELGYKPEISVQDGIGRFVAWYKDFYKK